MTTLSYHHHCRGSRARRLPLSFFSNILLATALLLSCCSTSRRNSSLMIVVGVNGADVVEGPQHRQQQLLEPPDDYVDDIYHCDNPLENNIIRCNFVTFTWVVTDLVPDSPPQECEDNILLAAAISTEGFQDRDEPCLLWYLMYGAPNGDTYITPSPFYNEENNEAPTQAPMAAPTQAPIAAVTDQPSGTIIPFVPDDTSNPENEEVQQQDNPLHKAIGPFTLTYIWPEKNNRSFVYELNRSELHTITSRHILEALQAELGLSNVKHVNLILTPSQPSSRTRTETLTGNVVLLDFNDEQQPDPSTVTMITQQQLQQIVAAAFQGNAMELYLFRLQIAKDMALRNIIQVILGTDGSNLSPQDNNNNQNGNDNNGDDEIDSSSFFADNILLITITLSAVAAILALCCFIYCLLVSGRRRKSGRDEKDEMNNKSNTSKDAVPAVSTKPTNSQEEDVIGVALGGGDGNLHVSGGDHSPPPPQTIPGDDEENRSLYSYLNNNDDDALSAAPSFLFSVHEADICQDDSGSSNNNTATEADKSLKHRQKRGVLWSVMDSFHSAFVNGDDDDDVDDYDNDGVSPLSIKEETSSKPKFFGEQEEPREKSNPSGIMYKGVLYSEEGTDDDNRSALTFDDNKSMITYDYDLTVGINGILNDDDRSTLAAQTPVRQRFEALWKEEDEEDHVRDYLPTTVKKSNRTMQVYEDDDEEEASEGLNVSTDTADASDDSPHTLLTQASRNPNTDTLLKNDQPILVDRTPETDSEEEEEEEEDNKLPLPSAILVGTSKGSNHQGDDTYHSETDSIGSNQSINSGKSNQSNGSSRSSASSRPRFQPTNGTAASAKDIGSARKQRTSQWGGGGATKMYPSFLYQSASDNQSIGSLKSSATNASQKSHFTIQSTDSAKFRSLLNQEDTNDAALFNMTQSINTSGSTENSNLMATKLSYGDSTASPASKSSVSSSNKAVTTTAAAPSQVSTLIQSFDKVWNDDEDDTDKENDSTTNNKNVIQPLRFEHLRVDMSYDKKNGGDDASTVASVYASPTMASF